MKRPVQKIRKISYVCVQKAINEINFALDQIHRIPQTKDLVKIIKQTKENTNYVLDYCVETLEEQYKKSKDKRENKINFKQ